MKAVVYHADAHFAWGGDVGDVYQRLFPHFVKHAHKYGFDEVIHLTLDGHPGWGDTNIFYKGYKPEDVMYNREMIFAEFLENAPDGTYFFGEPDYCFLQPYPPLEYDCAFVYRNNKNPRLTPAWRLFKQKAHPIMRELANLVREVEIRPGVGRDWHCDSVSFQQFYNKLHKPIRTGVYRYKGFDIELRNYIEYIKSDGDIPQNINKYSMNYKGPHKLKILDRLEKMFPV